MLENVLLHIVVRALERTSDLYTFLALLRRQPAIFPELRNHLGASDLG